MSIGGRTEIDPEARAERRGRPGLGRRAHGAYWASHAAWTSGSCRQWRTRNLRVAVGRAEGATLEDSIPDDIVERTKRGPRDAGNSMLADRRAGRPMEYDARNGVIVRLGRKHGIAAPMNALMVTLLEAAQAS